MLRHLNYFSWAFLRNFQQDFASYSLDFLLCFPKRSRCSALNFLLEHPAPSWLQHAFEQPSTPLSPRSWRQHALHATLWTFSWNVSTLLMLRFEPSWNSPTHALDATLHHGLDATVSTSSWTFQRVLDARLLISTCTWFHAPKFLLKHSNTLLLLLS